MGGGEDTHKEIKVTQVKNFTNSKLQITMTIGREPLWIRFIPFIRVKGMVYINCMNICLKKDS